MKKDYNNIEFWKPIYEEYINGESIYSLSKKHKIDRDTLKKYFLKFDFNLKTDNEINTDRYAKTQKSMLEKYGVENSFQSEEIKEKIKQTNIGKYGVENPRQCEHVKEKAKVTNTKKYGTVHPCQSETVKNKIKQTNIEKHFDILLEKIKDKYEFLDDFKGIHPRKNGWVYYRFKCLVCGNKFETALSHNQPICPICYPPLAGKSKLEDEIESFINSLGFKTERNVRILDKKEIDIYIPEKNIGIEVNGVYYHNSNPESHSCKSRNYHKQKTDLAREKGIKLIHVWDCFNLDIYKSMIRNLLGKIENRIYARKCQVKNITKKEERLFFEQNHIHGYTLSSESLGLVYNNELVSVISFRKNNNRIEIARFANKLNTNVMGGFSRLLKHSDIQEDVITYCDIEFCPFMTDSVYYKNGFEFIKETEPKLYFIDSNKCVHNRHEFMSHKLKDRLKKYDENLTAEENLYMNDIFSIYLTGNWKFVKRGINHEEGL